jgi:hypothetical protein
MSLPTRGLLFAALFMLCASLAPAQEDRGRAIVASHASTAEAPVPSDPTYIPRGSKIYINEIQGFSGFENYLVAAFNKKKVDLAVVTDRSQADFEITGFADHNRAGWAKIIFGSGTPESEASIQVINLRTSVDAYAVGSYKVDAPNGRKSTAEHLARNLRQKMERDDKKFSKK